MRLKITLGWIVISMVMMGVLCLDAPTVEAAPDLNPGDIAIILYNSDAPDTVAFVALADIGEGEILNFTDNGWLAAGGFRGNEGTDQWVAPAGGVPAGTIVHLTVDKMALSADGDQVLVYQGTDTSPSFIYALNNEGSSWQANAESSNTSALPTGLVNGISAVALNEVDNAVLICSSPQTHTKENFLAYISHPANWTGSNSIVQSIDPGCSFTIVDEEPPVEGCGETFRTINEIQGSGTSITLSGIQTTEGVVSHLTSGFGGFYIQSLTGDWDADDATSEGLFVYDPRLAQLLAPGDHVRLTGTASDYSGSYGNIVQMTQLGAVTDYQVCEQDVAIQPIMLNLPIPGDPDSFLERYEGMLVTIPQVLTVQQNYFQGRFGQLTLGSGGRIFNPHNGNGGDYTENLQRMIVLDDSSGAQNPNPIPYYGSDGALRAGDRVTGITGIIDQGRINSSTTSDPAQQVFPNVFYRIHPTVAPVFTQVNPRPDSPPEVGGRLKVASFNVLNYFTTLDQSPFPVGSPYTSYTEPRGPDSVSELLRQENKLVKAIAGLDSDIVALIEIESWDEADAVQTLVDRVNGDLGSSVYAISGDPFDTDFDVIQQALIYRTQTVMPVGDPQFLTVSPFNRYRPPLAQLFEDRLSGERFWVIVNHYKSKRCSGSETGGDQDAGEGSGCYNQTRVEMSLALLDWIDTALAPIDGDVLVVGDFNSYGGEPPITALKDGGLINQLALYLPPEDRYSYTYDGMAGYLEHALTSVSLSQFVTGGGIWHINTDEPSVIDYNTEYKSVDLYQVNPYRTSDHDPLIIGLDFGDIEKFYLPLFLQ